MKPFTNLPTPFEIQREWVKPLTIGTAENVENFLRTSEVDKTIMPQTHSYSLSDQEFRKGSEDNVEAFLQKRVAFDRQRLPVQCALDQTKTFSIGSSEEVQEFLSDTTAHKKINAKQICIDNTDEKRSKSARFLNKIAHQLISALNFIVYKKVLYYYNGRFWEVMDIDTFISKLKSELSNDVAVSFSYHDYNEIFRQIKTAPSLERENDPFDRDNYYVCFHNGVYGILEDKLLSHSPKYYFRSCIKADFQIEHHSKGIFERYLEICSNDDPMIRHTLLEMIGYIISDLNSAKALFLLLGNTDAGKTTFANFLLNLIGEDNAHAVIIQNLGDRFTTASLERKKLIFDMDVSADVWGKKVIGTLKKITGHDKLIVENKFEKAKDIRTTCKILLSSNQIPNIPYADAAFLKRLKVIPFGRTLSPDEQDPELLTKLASEKDYILTKSFEALRGLINKQFEFTKTYTLDEIKRIGDYGETVSSYSIVKSFMSERCSFESDAFTYNSDLYSHYLSFIGAHDICIPVLTQNVFSKLLLKAGNGNLTAQARNNGRGFRGISINPLQHDRTTGDIE